MKNKILHLFKNHYPLIAAIFFLWLIVICILIFTLQLNDGHVVYTQDDPYIHMSIAKNFAQTGVWGVNNNSFSFSSSSILWVCLLSLSDIIFGINDASPLILNIIFSTILIIVLYKFLKNDLSKKVMLFALISFILFIPIPPIIFTGMEHILQIILTILFAYFSANYISGLTSASSVESNKTQVKSTVIPRDLKIIMVIAPILTMTRYEGLFLVAVVCVILSFKRKPTVSVIIGLLGFLPVLLFGLISMSKGWNFLPNSILLKGNMHDISSLTSIIHNYVVIAFHKYNKSKYLVLLLILAITILVIQYKKEKSIKNRNGYINLFFIFTTIIHMEIADVGMFYRYEAYLVALGIFTVLLSGKHITGLIFQHNLYRKFGKREIAFILCLIIILYPFWKRTYQSYSTTPQATHNIYHQQYLMGKFLKEFYSNEVVAANDIGVINYVSNIKCFDIWGVANLEICRLMMEHKYTSSILNKLIYENKVKCAIVYDRWINEIGGIPVQWFTAGRWKLLNNVVCGGDTVTFYAFDKQELGKLKNRLELYSSKLPKDVVWLK